MAFPTVVDTIDGRDITAKTSHTLTLPTNSVDQLILIAAYAEPSGLMTISGYDILKDTAAGSADVRLFTKTSTGAEATATLEITTSEKMAYQAYVISGWNAIECSASATGFGTTPNPDSLTPSWGSADTLWIAFCFEDNKLITSGPSGYTDLIDTEETNHVGIGSARKEVAAAAEDPGTFLLNGNITWRALTVGVQPGSKGSVAQGLFDGMQTLVSIGCVGEIAKI